MNLLLLLVLSVFASADSSLDGHWQYVAKVYQGVTMPEPPEASLRLHFEFHDGISRLYWWHEGESDFCERLGKFDYVDGYLVDEVTWVNPRNTLECGRDPDMQQGRVSRTPVSFQDGQMVFHLVLGDEPLLYVWKRMEEGL